MAKPAPPDTGSDNGNPLVHIEDMAGLSKPAITLIERVSDAFGGVFRPWQIRRVAQAEADAEIIWTHADTEASAIKRRALNRMLAEERRNQENMERITADAVRQIGNDAKPEEMADDWIANFFEKCRIISDRDMQALWARLLAGEANVPGTYSARTINCIRDLSKDEAEMFTNLCRFVWNIGGETVPVIFAHDQPLSKKNGISFEVLAHLDAIGLIVYSGSPTNYRVTEMLKSELTSYFGRNIVLTFPGDPPNELPVGMALLTKMGRELVPISGAAGSDDILEHVVRKWTGQYLAPHCPWPRL